MSVRPTIGRRAERGKSAGEVEGNARPTGPLAGSRRTTSSRRASTDQEPRLPVDGIDAVAEWANLELGPGRMPTGTAPECANLFPTRKARLISVEVKLRLTAGDIRESFFQTVSNSHWANRSYLAATRIIGDDTWRELEMLCALHGVGYINLDVEDPRSGRIMIPAREREEVDWASANRIAAESEDFQIFLKAVLNYLETGEVTDTRWETV